ncbi:MAG: GIY-YIG nuclease family protein [Candidatus Omnitrophica bacterium]|nr:GIY-YIG nuclease family protein [Candidatus Omnitrophota bacterium]
MEEKERTAKRGRPKKKENWFLYMLECCDGSLYTGVTKDLQRRLKMHNDGKASRYTRTRRPVRIIYQEPCGNRTRALVRECAVKALPKKKKEQLAKNKVFLRSNF